MSNIHDWLNANPSRDDEDASARTVLSAPTLSPDDVAAQRRLSQEAGVPHVLGDNPLTAQAAEVRRLRALRDDNPRLHGWLSQPQNYAVARDDVANLAQVERMGANETALQQWTDQTRAQFDQQPWLRPFKGFISLATGLGRPGARALDQAGETGQYYSGEAQDVLGGVEQQEMFDLQRQQQRAFEGIAEPLNDAQAVRLAELSRRDQPRGGIPILREALRQAPLMAGSFGRAGGEIFGDTPPAGTIYDTPEGRLALHAGRPDFTDLQQGRVGDFAFDAGGDFAREVYHSFGSIPGSGLLTYIWDMEAVGVYETAIQQGVPAPIARNAAEQAGMLNAAVELFGEGLILRQSGAGDLIESASGSGVRAAIRNVTLRQALARAGTRVAQAGVTGGAEEGIQETFSIMAESAARARAGVATPADLQLAERYAQSIQGGMEGGVGLGSPVTTANLYLDYRAIQRGERARAAFAELANNATASKLRERLPSAAAEAVDASLADTPMGVIRIEADGWVEHFQSQGVDPAAAAAQVGVSRADLQQALASHGDLQISTGQYYAHLAASAHNTALMRHARWNANDFTESELEAKTKEFETALREAVKDTAVNDNDIGAVVEQRMRELFAQAEQEGGPRAEIAARYAKVPAALVRTMVARARASGDTAYAARLETRFRALFGDNLDIAGPTRELAGSGAELPQSKPAAARLREFLNDDRPWREALQPRDRVLVDGALADVVSNEGGALVVKDVASGQERVLPTVYANMEVAPVEQWPGPTVAAAAPKIHPTALRFGTEAQARELLALIESGADAEAILSSPIFAAIAAHVAASDPTVSIKQAQDIEVMGARAFVDPETGEALDLAQAVERLRAVYVAKAGGELALDRRAVVVTGHPGAGKSTFIEALARDYRAAVADADVAKSYIPAYEAGYNTQAVHNESASLRAMAVDPLIDEGANLIFERVGDRSDTLLAQLEQLAEAGYSVEIVHVDVAPDEAVRRMARRFLSGGRYIDPQYYRQVIGKTKPAFDQAIADSRWKAYVEVDANGPPGQHQIARQGGAQAEALSQTLRRQPVSLPQEGGQENAGGTRGAEGGSLNQATAEQGQKRGSIRYENFRSGEFGTAMIRMGEASDLSTFLHEFGHLGHLILESIATDQNAPAEFKQMWANTLAWWGVSQEQWDGLSDADKVQHFERWARTFEAYLMEGKAPSLSLREAFAAFKAWLLQVYRSVFALDHNLNPQIRDVFDRLLATDAEMAEARAAMGGDFTLPLETFTDEQRALIGAAREAQDAELRARVMDRYVRKEKRWWRAERARVRTTAEIEVDSDPARRAYDWLAFSEWRALPVEQNEEGVELPATAELQMPEGLPDMRLDPQALQAEYGEGVFDELPVGLRPLAGDVATAQVLRRLDTMAADVPRNPVPRARVRAAFPKDDGGTRVSARPATEDGEIKTSWATLEVRAGRDMIVGEAQNDARPVRRDIFDMTYAEVAPGEWQKRSDVPVGYFIADQDTTIRTLEGPVEAAKGDVVLIGAVGEMWPIKAEKFAQRYTIADGPVDAALEQAMALKRQGRARQPTRLWKFIKDQGGIRDEGGEIGQALGSARARPGLINNASGLSADELALRAWEQGYFGAKPRKGEYFQDRPRSPSPSPEASQGARRERGTGGDFYHWRTRADGPEDAQLSISPSGAVDIAYRDRTAGRGTAGEASRVFRTAFRLLEEDIALRARPRYKFRAEDARLAAFYERVLERPPAGYTVERSGDGFFVLERSRAREPSGSPSPPEASQGGSLSPEERARLEGGELFQDGLIYHGSAKPLRGIRPILFATPDKPTAAFFARLDRKETRGPRRVTPLKPKFDNPVEIEANGALINAMGTTKDLWKIVSDAQANGNDAVIVHNVIDGPAMDMRSVYAKPIDVYIILDPSKVEKLPADYVDAGPMVKRVLGMLGSFQLFQDEPQSGKTSARPLVAVHNTTAKKLLHAIRMGGMAVPSLAIARADIGFDNFGDITLIAPPSLIDPRGGGAARVFDADVYSPRYPQISHKVNDRKFRALIERQPFQDASRDLGFKMSTELDDSTLRQNGMDAILESTVVQLAYARMNGIEVEVPIVPGYREGEVRPDYYAVRQDLRERVANDPAFMQWAEAEFRPAFEGERIFQGWTNAGNARYLPHNLDTVVRVLKRELRDGEGFNYGVGSIRSKVAREFSSVTAIKKARDQIVDHATMEALKNEANDEFVALANRFLERSGRTSTREQMGFLDTFSEHLKEVAETGRVSVMDQYYREPLTVEDKAAAVAFLEKLRSLPTEYFEAKIRRAVGLNEFVAAVVPDNTDAKTMEALHAAGITDIRTYPKGDVSERQRAVMEVRPRELFQDEDVTADRRPTPRELLDALIDDLKNVRQVFSSNDLDAVAAYQNRADALRWFEARDIDLSGSKEEIRAQIVAAMEREAEAPNGVHPDDAAPWFGFSSGDEMIQAIKGLKPRAQAIEENIDARLEGEYGDPMRDGTFAEAARLAAHIEVQARKIEMELAAIEQATGGKSRPVGAVAKAYAEDQVEGMSLREIRNAEVYLAGERRAARAAYEAAAKKNWPEAARQKSKQLLCFWLYKFARDAAQNVERIETRWKRYSTGATTRAAIGPRHIEQIDAILDTIETGRPQFRPTQTLDEWTKTLAGEGNEDLLVFNPEVVTQQIRRPLAQMSYSDVLSLNDVLRNIETIGRGMAKLRKAQEAERIADIVADLKARVREEYGPRLERRLSLVAPNTADKIGRQGNFFAASMLKMDFLARRLDGFKDGGPFMRLFGQMAQEAENDLYSRNQTAAAEIQQIFREHYTPAQFKLLLTKRLHIPAIDDSRTKMQLIAYALNRGTRYNFDALLKGEGWNELTYWQVVAPLDRNDWSFVQALWRYIGQWKEESFALDERTRGARPVEEVGEQFQLPNGAVIQGQYWPVAFDSDRSDAAAEREARDTVIGEFGGRFRQPSTSRGRLISRRGTGGQALSSDPLGILAKHVHDTLRDLTHRDLVITLRKVKSDKELRNMIARVASRDHVRALDAWVFRLAQKLPAQAFGDWGRVPAYLRRSLTNHAMGLKVSVATLNLLGHFQAMPRNGVIAQVKQAGITMAVGFPDLLRRHAMAFATGEKEASARVRFVTEKSAAMAAVLQGSFDRDINDVKGDMLGRREGQVLPKAFEDTLQILNIYTNQIVGVPTWLAAYESALNGEVKGIAADNDEASVAYADSVVRMTISAGATKDLSAIVASNNQWQRLFTVFMNWASIFYNQVFEEQVPAVMAGKISFPRFAANLVWIWLLPGVISMMFYGQGDQRDDEDEFQYMARMALTVLIYPLQTIPLVRDFMSQMVQGYTPKTAIDNIYSRSAALQRAFEDDNERQIVKQAALLGGAVTGVPAQAYVTGDYFADWAAGEEDPAADPWDALEEALLRDRR